MRVLLITHQFLPDFEAGTEVLAHGVARELVRRGHAVSIFTGFPDEGPRGEDERFDQYTHGDLRVYRFRHAHRPMGGCRSVVELGYRNPVAERAFARVLQAEQPEIAHFFNFARVGISLVDLAWARSAATLYTATDYWASCPTAQLVLPDGSPCGGPSPLAANCLRHLAALSPDRVGAGVVSRLPLPVATIASAVLRAVPPGMLRAADEVKALAARRRFVAERMRRIDRVLAPTHFMSRAVRDLGVAQERIELVPYGVEQPAASAPPGTGTRRRPGPLRLGFIGTLSRHKGLHVLLDALDATPPAQIELAVYGTPGADAAYTGHVLARVEGMTNARVEGRFPNAAILEVLAGIDALVVPSVWPENAPLVVLSAFAAGKPVIASDQPGLRAMVTDGVDGLLFRPGDGSALARQLSRLLAEPGLLPRLVAGVQPPCSVAQHVDAAERAYGEARRRRQHTVPLTAGTGLA